MVFVNPLLAIQYRIPFDKIRAEHVETAIEQLLLEARQSQKSLSESVGPRTFETTLLALEGLTEKLDWAMGVVGHLESVATYPELRDAYNAVQGPVSLFYSQVTLDAGIYLGIKEYALTEEAQQLTGARRRFLKKTLEAFRRNGAELDEAGKAELTAIDVELAQLTTSFGQHVLDSTNEFELVVTDPADLAGLPPSAVDAAKQNAEARKIEGWRFTLQSPSYIAVLTYMAKPEYRELLYRAYMARATSGPLSNLELLRRILQLRDQRARLLGYRNFADLVLEERMAQNGDAAKAFLERLRERTRARFDQENAALQEFREELEGPGAAELQPWDVSYYAEKLRVKMFDFDEEALRPYYPLPQVEQGMYELVERLYGIRIVAEEGAPVWHPDVKYYRILDEDGGMLGAFYADWFPRETKRGGAWMDAFLTAFPMETDLPADLRDGESLKVTSHLGLVCGNLTPPLGDKPALLTHREVETVFHEFGHLLHHSLSKVEIRSLSGTRVAWDFVELPSQIMENWCWERESLDLFARHWETGEPIPGDLFAKMRRARTFRSANLQMRQLGFGVVDLLLHTEHLGAMPADLLEYTRDILQTYSPAPLPRPHGMICGFTHLFSAPVAYAAGYYSYKWAEVLDADAFTRFQEAGVFSRDVGLAFRKHILSQGNSEEPAELYRSFMGRDPDVEALMRRSGLA